MYLQYTANEEKCCFFSCTILMLDIKVLPRITIMQSWINTTDKSTLYCPTLSSTPPEQNVKKIINRHSVVIPTGDAITCLRQ